MKTFWKKSEKSLKQKWKIFEKRNGYANFVQRFSFIFEIEKIFEQKAYVKIFVLLFLKNSEESLKRATFM